MIKLQHIRNQTDDLELKTNIIVQFSIHIIFANRNANLKMLFFNLNNNDICKIISLLKIKREYTKQKKSQFSYLNYVLDFFCISNDKIMLNKQKMREKEKYRKKYGKK